ncbi:hypothetical protein V5799_022536, partial [Amblyomma americanum]
MRPSPDLVDVCWAVPFLTACASFLFSMPKTNSGILFVLFVDHFGVSRETASWPKTIESAASSFMGFAIGAAQQRLSVYSVIAGGAVLCPIAVIASAFAPNMTWMSVTVGFLYGISFGLLIIGSSIYIVSYFESYQNTAAGIKFFGVSLTGAIGPSLLSHLASTYGVQGCLLVTGGLLLNLIPLTLMLRNPRPLTWPQFFCRWCCTLAKNKAGMTISGETTLEGTQSMQNEFIERAQGEQNSISGKPDDKATRASAIREKDESHKEPRLPASREQRAQQSDSFAHGDDMNRIIAQLAFVLRKPCFYVILVAMVAADFTLPLLGSTVVDYGRDKQLPPKDSSQLLTYLSLGALCGYALIPIVSDKFSRKRCLIAALSFTLLSVCFGLMPHVYSSASTAAVTFFSGVQLGYVSTLKPVLVADYLGVHAIAVSWGLMGLASLPLTFCEPSIV